MRDGGWSEGRAKSSESSERKEVVGRGSGPNERFRVRVRVRSACECGHKMKPGIGMAVGRDLDLGSIWEKRNEVFCRRDGPRESGRQKY